ncbi:hypothetical protein MSSAC_3995 [Methanosarcina siciliae C2J]|uniref:Uncharacterized protein n=1 Tax=Methanosarcina siciliae C2J TaxID=1434118 RepID=A0A0E3PTH1_9EURY|nr:hypothetical protein MSSAC_3995 [Methanosarcina siciliae C2J]
MIPGILKQNTSKPADPESRLILKVQKSVRIKSRKIKSNRALLPPKVRKILKPKKSPVRPNYLLKHRETGHFRAGRLSPFEL